MPFNFSGPTSHPISLGDNYSLYKRSILPVIPVVDSVVLEEGEVAEPPIEAEPVVEQTQDGGQEELDVKRKTSPTEESSTGGESNKKLKEENSVDQSAGQGSDLVEKSGSSTGGTVAAVSSESHGDEPKVGDEAVSVPAKPERDHPKQETKQKSYGS
tara:strand:+ start:1441 stop:1911 length:471 start_codon:yes stop_codon:yes gene_type:complete